MCGSSLIPFYWISIEKHCRKKPATHEHAWRKVGVENSARNCFIFCKLKGELIGRESRIYLFI